jgi:hypothetical protein
MSKTPNSTLASLRGSEPICSELTDLHRALSERTIAAAFAGEQIR